MYIRMLIFLEVIMKEFKDYFSKSEIVLGSVKEFSQNGLQALA